MVLGVENLKIGLHHPTRAPMALTPLKYPWSFSNTTRRTTSIGHCTEAKRRVKGKNEETESGESERARMQEGKLGKLEKGIKAEVERANLNRKGTMTGMPSIRMHSFKRFIEKFETTLIKLAAQ